MTEHEMPALNVNHLWLVLWTTAWLVLCWIFVCWNALPVHKPQASDLDTARGSRAAASPRQLTVGSNAKASSHFVRDLRDCMGSSPNGAEVHGALDHDVPDPAADDMDYNFDSVSQQSSISQQSTVAGSPSEELGELIRLCKYLAKFCSIE